MTLDQLEVAPDIWCRYEAMKLVCVTAGGLDNKSRRPALDMHFAKSQHKAALALKTVDPETFAPFLDWRAVQPGPKFMAAHEALARRVTKAPLRSISPVVDIYNGLSLELTASGIAAPIGGWCLDTLPRLKLLVTKGGERFCEIGKTDPVFAELGETGYADATGTELVTRHFVWRQAALGAISPETQSFILVCELLAPYASYAEFVRAKMVDACARYLAVACRSVILSDPTAAIDGEAS
jgi:DNA/RNA-binding domain of Phe-tRNA-synthetase-like protein